jgi:hypothetical protein
MESVPILESQRGFVNLDLSSSPQFLKSLRNKKVGTTQAGQVSKALDLMIEKERQVSIFRI